MVKTSSCSTRSEFGDWRGEPAGCRPRARRNAGPQRVRLVKLQCNQLACNSRSTTGPKGRYECRLMIFDFLWPQRRRPGGSPSCACPAPPGHGSLSAPYARARAPGDVRLRQLPLHARNSSLRLPAVTMRASCTYGTGARPWMPWLSDRQGLY
jgi:hypothetical protein